MLKTSTRYYPSSIGFWTPLLKLTACKPKIPQLLIPCIGKQTGNSSSPALDYLVIFSDSKLITNIQLIWNLHVQQRVRLCLVFSQRRHCLRLAYFHTENPEIQRTVCKCFRGSYPYQYFSGKSCTSNT